MKNRVQSHRILLLATSLACLVCLAPGYGRAVPQPVAAPPSETVTVFRSWIGVLEARQSPSASWESPFGAPRPGELSDAQLATALELRHLARSGKMADLEAAIDRAVRENTEPATQIQFWLAYGLQAVGRREAGLPRLVGLLRTPGPCPALMAANLSG